MTYDLNGHHELALRIPFIALDEGNFTLCSDALELIAALPCPISVCTVFGAPGTGKTTLVQSILKSGQEEFHHEVWNESELSTRQKFSCHSENCPFLWFWNRPITVPCEDGESITLIVLESGHGFGSWKEHESVIFALSVLLSDHVLYTGVDLLDESISELRPIRCLTKIISTKATAEEEEDGIDFGRFFPHLTWVIRDHPDLDSSSEFATAEEDSAADDAQAASARALALAGREYLERALRVSGFSDQAPLANILLLYCCCCCCCCRRRRRRRRCRCCRRCCCRRCCYCWISVQRAAPQSSNHSHPRAHVQTTNRRPCRGACRPDRRSDSARDCALGTTQCVMRRPSGSNGVPRSVAAVCTDSSALCTDFSAKKASPRSPRLRSRWSLGFSARLRGEGGHKHRKFESFQA